LYQKNQEYDLNKVAAIINTTVINSEVISYWKKYAQNRQTVILQVDQHVIGRETGMDVII
ncbi:MAG: hypothetical protein Q8830_02700, partial [Candidatus Phytoplasma australasiaticum]|nr:hypothetical protein [Candidatus Phytoplasma australasiaticum]